MFGGNVDPDERRGVSLKIVHTAALLNGLPYSTRVPNDWRGSIDNVSRDQIRGWAQNGAYPEEPVALQIIDDGEVVARVPANRYRPDLKDAGLGTDVAAVNMDRTAAEDSRSVAIGS